MTLPMARRLGLALMLAGGAAETAEVLGAASVTPVQKVVQLLEGMKTQGVHAREEEATKFAAFAQWCKDQQRTKSDEIDAGKQRIDHLSAKIEKGAATVVSLTSRIQELDGDISRWERDSKSAAAVREQEAADYRATSRDYGESLSAVGDAIVVLKQKDLKHEQQADALLQVSRLRTLSGARKMALSRLAAAPPADMSPEAYGYEFQSGGVIELLGQLQDDFDKKKRDLDHEELAAKHAFEDMAQQLADNTRNAQHEVDKKTTSRAEEEGSKSSNEGLKKQVASDLGEDQKYLEETVGLCTQKSEDFEARQKLRLEELDAIDQAVELLAGGAVAGAAEKHLPSLLQLGRGRRPSFAQLRSTASNAVQARAAAFLAQRAAELNSKVLLLASRSSSSDPFGKVKKMIRGLISELMKDSTQEIEHKGWCDTELTTNRQTRDQKTEAVQQLTARTEEQTAMIARLTQDIEELTHAVGELDAALASATEERAASKEKNEVTVADAQKAQQAISAAMAVLKDFYAKSVEATALVQSEDGALRNPEDDAPETFDKSYTGMAPEGGGVMDLLEVILGDFGRLETEVSAAEATEQDEFKQFAFETQKDKALKENEKDHKAAKQEETQQALAEAGEELQLTQSQLDKAAAYYDKLKPTCVDTGISYQERVRHREEELQSLQEALQMLQGAQQD